jgi:hypothetical protein
LAQLHLSAASEKILTFFASGVCRATISLTPFLILLPEKINGIEQIFILTFLTFLSIMPDRKRAVLPFL